MSTSCVVTEISWARIHLSITVNLTGPWAGQDVHFMIADGDRRFPVPTQRIGAEHFRLDVNVTNFRARRQIPDGTWRIVPYLGDDVPLPAEKSALPAEKPALPAEKSAPPAEEPTQQAEELTPSAPVDDDAEDLTGPPATYDLNDLERLAQDSRTFIYDSNRASYMVVFGISEDDDRPALLMRTYSMSRRPRSGASRKRSLPRWAKAKVLPRSRRVDLLNRLYRLARRVQPPNGKRVLFASELRPGMEGNLLAIHDRMVQRGLDRTLELRYSFRMPHTGGKKSTLRLVWLLATSDIVLIDDYFVMLQSLRISPDTKIIQAWHAGSGFKSVGYSRFGNYGSPKLQNAHRKYTYALTGSTHLVPVYAEAFGIEESAVIPTGLPRIDTFLDPARTASVVDDFFAEYPHLRGKRLILFAPTFRGRGSSTAYYDYSRIDFGALYDVCEDDSVVLFRMHHFIREPIPIPAQYADRLLDFSSYPSTNDLLHVTNVLITDYSSIIYEFALLDRPMLFFAYDKDSYAATRGFHRDYDLTAPGKVCESMDELVKALQDEDYDLWKVEQFRAENFDAIDTHSADRVIDWLILGDLRTSESPDDDSVLAETTAVEPVTSDSTPAGSQVSEADVSEAIQGEGDEA